MAGSKANLGKMWDQLRTKLDLDPPTKFNDSVYLGCGQHDVEPHMPTVEAKRKMYAELFSHDKNTTAGSKVTEKSAQEMPTDHRASTKMKSMAKGTDSSGIRAYAYKMKGHAVQCVERYCELAKADVSSLKQVATPAIDDHLMTTEDFVNKGVLSSVCSRIVLKILYLARLSRPDLLYAVNTLAREVTRWNVACDKRLQRLIAYIHHTVNYEQYSYVGDGAENIKVVLFVDAGFAGDLKDSKSTSGAYLCLVGENTFVPISSLCKKQGPVSHSTSEAELIALEAALRMEGIPALMLWETVVEVFSNHQGKALGKPTPPTKIKHTVSNCGTVQDPVVEELLNVDYVPFTLPPSSGIAKLFVMEDNDAVIKMTVKERFPTMRHCPRSHRINLDWLKERFSQDPGISIKYIGTKDQIADMFTKGQFTAQQWLHLLGMAQIGDYFVKQDSPKVGPAADKKARATPPHENPNLSQNGKRGSARVTVALSSVTVETQDHKAQRKPNRSPQSRRRLREKGNTCSPSESGESALSINKHAGRACCAMIIMKPRSVAILAQGNGPESFPPKVMRVYSRARYYFVLAILAAFLIMSLMGSVQRMVTAVAGKAKAFSDAQERSSHPQLQGLPTPPPPPAFLPQMVPTVHTLAPQPQVVVQL